MIRVDVIDMNEVVEMAYDLNANAVILLTYRADFDSIVKAFKMRNYIRFVLEDLDEFLNVLMKVTDAADVYVF